MLSHHAPPRLGQAALALVLVLGVYDSSQSAGAETAPHLPASASAQFCVQAQQLIASTEMTGENTVFSDMPSYRHSKPGIQPLTIFQVVTYDGKTPMVVSCKMKTAAHLRAVYGPKTAGEQKFCHHAARALQQQAIDELTAEGDSDAAARVAAYIIDTDEPFITGQAYLKDFRTIYRAGDGSVHISTPGLYQDYDAWYTFLLPEIVQGQSYCHLATSESLKAVATGKMQPGMVFNTGDNAATQPK